MQQKSTLPGAFDRQAYMIALLVFIAGSTNAAVVPFIGFYIIQVLGHPPATVGFYSVTAALASIVASRVYGERVDAGMRVKPLLLLSVCGALVAAAAASFGHMALLVAVTATGMGLSNAASTLIFSYGRYHGRVKGLDTAAYNAFLRTMVSLAWMLVPAAAYLIFDLAGAKAVFVNAMLMAVIWGGLALVVVPLNQTSPMERRPQGEGDTPRNMPLLLAAAASFCMSFAHALCASALPVFLVREVGLPDYAPGLSLSVKCAMEVLLILLAPRIMRRISARLLLSGAAITAIIAFNIIASVTTLPAMLVGAAMEGAYYGLFAGTCLTFVQGFARGRTARATALYMNSIFLAALFAVPLMGFVSQYASFGASIRLASVGAGAALLLLFLTRRQVGE
ncbi:UNVERIFIED_ORG: SET family sugar efflux transporter-like MFS transporter [Rhizobium sp. SORGH_AS260]|uniref:MFS transporter n=1 Tax=Hyphomicrobiales TaxID=356 RepID=UPI0003129295|nr:MFS transporter [Agrobacterium sp. SORGH_AS_0440]MDP9731599.1 SET family sugar efflux transporter-like MFS transporter [Rhizobium sp. SORGH_AS_0285]MDP9752347.1 SET family sugar efflux transporter-like MFS transporter [Rhizobium sp. SORGH_AS_0260]MDR6079306.1 SET family sugar efflux transporter-like MFS transporter [Agrobacterium sp. SORGH_AS_0440]